MLYCFAALIDLPLCLFEHPAVDVAPPILHALHFDVIKHCARLAVHLVEAALHAQEEAIAELFVDEPVDASARAHDLRLRIWSWPQRRGDRN